MNTVKKNDEMPKEITLLKCSVCRKSDLVFKESHYECNSCQTRFEINHGVLDTLVDLSGPTKNEILGMALENGFSKENFLDFKIRIKKEFAKISDKLTLTEGTHGNYYLQTMMNFKQAIKELDLGKGSRVLEIGACYDYYFLGPFREMGCETYALNIHFDLVEDSLDEEYPIKVLGDMNNLPFADDSFDVVVMSATSHHSTTPNILIDELSRVLKKGGKCLMINDPTWGVVKNLGGPDNTMAFRESHINENEYPIWKYNKWFRKSGFKIQHNFSSFHEQVLSEKEILPGTRFYLFAKIFQKLWRLPLLNKIFKSYGLWFLQAVFGFPMNAVLTKK